MRSSLDLAWAAGFLEGEGFFGCNVHSPAVMASQVHREPLDKLQRLFGGQLYPIIQGARVLALHPKTKNAWGWRETGGAAIAIMFTVYSCIQSPYKKQQIVQAVATWRTAQTKRIKGSGMCKRGHLLTEDNLYRSGPNGKYTKCKLCANTLLQQRRTTSAAEELSISDLLEA